MSPIPKEKTLGMMLVITAIRIIQTVIKLIAALIIRVTTFINWEL